MAVINIPAHTSLITSRSSYTEVRVDGGGWEEGFNPTDKF